MIIGSMRYLGSTGGTFTNNAVYKIVGWNGDSAIVIGDNDTIQTAAVGTDWAVEELLVISLEQLI